MLYDSFTIGSIPNLAPFFEDITFIHWNALGTIDLRPSSTGPRPSSPKGPSGSSPGACGRRWRRPASPPSAAGTSPRRRRRLLRTGRARPRGRPWPGAVPPLAVARRLHPGPGRPPRAAAGHVSRPAGSAALRAGRRGQRSRGPTAACWRIRRRRPVPGRRGDRARARPRPGPQPWRGGGPGRARGVHRRRLPPAARPPGGGGGRLRGPRRRLARRPHPGRRRPARPGSRCSRTPPSATSRPAGSSGSGRCRARTWRSGAPAPEAVGGFDAGWAPAPVPLRGRRPLRPAGRGRARGARCPDLVVCTPTGATRRRRALEAANDVARGAFVAERLAPAGRTPAPTCGLGRAAAHRWGWRPRNAARALGGDGPRAAGRPALAVGGRSRPGPGPGRRPRTPSAGLGP